MVVHGQLSQVARGLVSVSPKLGIVREVRRAHRLMADPQTVTFSAMTCNPGLSSHGFAHGVSGAGLNWQQAFLATVGEGLERYAAGIFDATDATSSTALELMQCATVAGPADFALFHAKQYAEPGFPFQQFTDSTRLYWTKTMDLVTGQTVYCPSVFQHLPFGLDDCNIAEQISTGFSIHSNPESALLGGIFEAIERDAFMISWANLLPLPKIKPLGSLSGLIHQIVPRHLDVHLFDMTTDLGVPCVLGLLSGEDAGGKVIVASAACRFSLYEAAEKAVLELCQGVPYSRYLRDRTYDFDDFRNVRTFSDHSVFYMVRTDLCGVFDDWLRTEATVDVDSNEPVAQDVQIQELRRTFARHGYPILVRDATTVDLHRLGFVLFRVVCPQLIPTNGTYGQYYLGGRRLYDVPAKLGYSVRNTYETLNALPHPFP